MSVPDIFKFHLAARRASCYGWHCVVTSSVLLAVEGRELEDGEASRFFDTIVDMFIRIK